MKVGGKGIASERHVRMKFGATSENDLEAAEVCHGPVQVRITRGHVDML